MWEDVWECTLVYRSVLREVHGRGAAPQKKQAKAQAAQELLRTLTATATASAAVLTEGSGVWGFWSFKICPYLPGEWWLAQWLCLSLTVLYCCSLGYTSIQVRTTH